jgi:hypothetical protein
VLEIRHEFQEGMREESSAKIAEMTGPQPPISSTLTSLGDLCARRHADYSTGPAEFLRRTRDDGNPG